MQKELRWFNIFNQPSSEEVQKIIDTDNPKNPFYSFVGNNNAKKRLCRAAFVALKRHNHCCSDQSFAILGPPSLGKTTLVKKFVELVELPFVEIHPKSIKNGLDIFNRINEVLTKRKTPLVPVKDNYYVCPPVVVFIDEVHALSNNVVQTLLKATEKNDCILEFQNDKMDTGNICWIIATTDIGDLFDAFVTRFTKITLLPYTLEEIAEIVKINTGWSMEVCRLVAKFSGRLPREALAFAKEMKNEKQLNPYSSWEEIANTIAEDNNIDEYGMTLQRLAILTALGQRGVIARSRICDLIGCREEELLKFIMPALTMSSIDQPALVQVTGRGYAITEEGLKELDKRNIKHIGIQAA